MSDTPTAMEAPPSASSHRGDVRVASVGVRLEDHLPAHLASRLPNFVLGWVKRLLHLDEINAFWRDHPDERGVPFLRSLLHRTQLSFRIHGTIPDMSRVLLVANHPTGIMDGLVLMGWLSTLHPHPKVLANSALRMVSAGEELLLPIEKPGGASAKRLSRALAQQLDSALRSDVPVLVFPAGQTAKMSWGGVREMPWNKFVVQRAQRYQRDVVPLFLEGGLSWRFHLLSVTRRVLQMKSHPETALLVDEAARLQGSRIEGHVGARIPFQTFDDSASHIAWAAWLREQCLACAPSKQHAASDAVIDVDWALAPHHS